MLMPGACDPAIDGVRARHGAAEAEARATRTGTLILVRVLACLPAILIAAAIWRLSDTPDLAIAHGWLDTVLRKAAHIGVFGALAAAAWLGLRAQRVRPATAIGGGAAIALVYACVDEWHQTRVPTRHGTPVDVAIDAIGIGIASMVLVMTGRRSST